MGFRDRLGWEGATLGMGRFTWFACAAASGLSSSTNPEP